jgi:MoxR-like ATPase
VLALCDHARQWGRLSTRAPLTLASVARGWAVLRGRTYVAPDDVRDVMHAVLAHRLASGGDRRSAHEIIDATLAAVAPPRPT